MYNVCAIAPLMWDGLILSNVGIVEMSPHLFQLYSDKLNAVS